MPLSRRASARFASVLLAAVLLAGCARSVQRDAPLPAPPPPTAPLVVMNLASHPDDEDGLTLAHYRHAHNAVAYSVIYNRGEGGQNEIGPDLYERLGAIRTAETEAAARILGTQVFFLDFVDFGYSKTAAESFAKWGGRDTVTAQLVYHIRKLKPDVIFTNHDTLTTGPRRQHGQHQVVGLSAYDAFALAADASYHPEQLAEPGVDLWQPKRLLLRDWRARSRDDLRARADVSGSVVAIPVGAEIPRLGEAAADRAVRAAAQHRSQGFDKFAPRFRRDSTFFVELRRAEGVAPLSEDATDFAAGLPPNPHAAQTSLRYRIDSERTRRLFDAPEAERTCFDYEATPSIAVPGDRIRVTMTQGDCLVRWPASGRHFAFGGAIDTTIQVVPSDDGGPLTLDLMLPADAEPTLPKYRAQYRRRLASPPITLALNDGAEADYLPVEIAPPVVLEDLPDVVRLGEGAAPITVAGQVYDDATTQVRVFASVVVHTPDPRVRYRPFWRVDTLLTPDADGRFTYVADAAALEAKADLEPGLYRFVATVEAQGTGGSTGAGYDEVRAEARVLPEIAIAEDVRVGFVKSYDDATLDALRAMGFAVTELDSTALAGDLSAYDTIVLDIRAYLVRNDLRRHNDRLLDWTRRGGHLVVMYNKTFEWNEGNPHPTGDGPPNAAYAPYPLTLGRDRVTVEEAAVEVLVPTHPLVTAPNVITDADWDGWIQERGLYFPATYDERYLELFAMADPDEAPLRSSTLFATVGDGSYLYTALGWYRQLQQFNPGAWRLVANMVSYPASGS
ncbi:MAG: PIG-L family deacetylase [Bacteroidota bacterium]